MNPNATPKEKTEIENKPQPLVEKMAVIGAGLGGLAVAIALRKQGYDVQVYEKAKDFRPVGGGFGLLPNGLNFLDAIDPGIVETIKNSGCEVKSSVLKNTQDATIRTTPRSIFGDKCRGRVTLLGDAAHPMAPALGQGANSTFEDAYELALCFSQASNIQSALATYEQRRIPRTQLIQTRSALGEMRYYATDREASEQQMQEQSQMSSEEYQDWAFNYKPSC